MQFQSILKRALSFAVAITVGVFATGLFVAKKALIETNHPVVFSDKDTGGRGSCKARGWDPGSDENAATETAKQLCPGTCALKILSKPRPSYTDLARQNNVRGSVTLRITFLTSGQIGSISPVKGLPDGLTEQAIAAARNIRFEPATKDGTPYAVARTVQYSFSIY